MKGRDLCTSTEIIIPHTFSFYSDVTVSGLAGFKWSLIAHVEIKKL